MHPLGAAELDWLELSVFGVGNSTSYKPRTFQERAQLKDVCFPSIYAQLRLGYEGIL